MSDTTLNKATPEGASSQKRGEEKKNSLKELFTKVKQHGDCRIYYFKIKVQNSTTVPEQYMRTLLSMTRSSQ